MAAPGNLGIAGPAGNLEIAVTQPRGDVRGVALIAHPHPLYGGTMDNKVVQTLARSFVAMGNIVWRMNFRGVGASEGVFDDGRGELDDFRALARHAATERPGLPLTLAGFSFGGYVVSHLAKELQPVKLVLVAPAVGRFPVADVPEHTLVIHGEEDDVVALKEVFAWAKPQKLPITVVPGAGHFFHGDLIKLQHIVTNSCACTSG
ncbi:MAG: alpha/beta hydrolase [Burkholderiales bacterium]|nr:alpha/beta hydrolase [Burkholderiales bacterium]